MKSKYATEKEIINILEIRDNAIKNYIIIALRTEIERLNARISITNENLEELSEKIEKLNEKVNKEIDVDRNTREELAHYCYTVEYDETVVSFENEKLFKEWFLGNIYKKRAFKANSKAWDVIYEAIGERHDVEMAEEDNY